MMLFSSLIGLCWAIFFVVWFVYARGAKKDVRRVTHKENVWFRVFLAVVIIFFFIPFDFQEWNQFQFFPSTPLVKGVGVALCSLGIALAIQARIHLGTNWGMPMTQKEDPELIMTGPYRLLRHPIYTGIGMAMLGSAMTLGSFWLIWGLFTIASFVYSAKKEEKVMLRFFADRYKEYMTHTWRMVPFIY